MAVALAIFVARPLLPGGTAGLIGLFCALLLLSAGWPLTAAAAPQVSAGATGPPTGEAAPPVSAPAAQGRVAPATRGIILAAGMAAFGLGRLLGGGRSPVHPTVGYAAAITIAAIAEELFFRRFVYAVLRPGGVALAVGGSAVLFALAHVTVYGWWVLPLDLAAGLVLGWQRWASGSWAVPAVTHVAANLLVIL
jgi:membrane protease YdiL (CAAX protease family)